jgi:hypothetical protein
MSTRYNNGSHYENHQRAAELQNGAAHAYRVAEEEKGKQDHLTAHELSRQELEHHAGSHRPAQTTPDRNGIATFGHNDIADLAHCLWQARGCPEGSPEKDWYEAVKELRARVYARAAGSLE